MLTISCSDLFLSVLVRFPLYLDTFFFTYAFGLTVMLMLALNIVAWLAGAALAVRFHLP